MTDPIAEARAALRRLLIQYYEYPVPQVLAAADRYALAVVNSDEIRAIINEPVQGVRAWRLVALRARLEGGSHAD